jgi:hypothetical protein
MHPPRCLGGALGFDITSKMICVVYHTNNQHLLLLEPDQLAHSVSLALINASKNLKSSYTCLLGKRAKVGSVDPTPTKRRGVVTLSSIVGTTAMPCSAMMPSAVLTPHLATMPHSATTPRSATMPHSVTTPCLATMSHAHFTTPIALRPIIMTPSSMSPSSATAHIATRPIIMSPSSMPPSSAMATSYLPSTMTGTYDVMLIDQDIFPQHMSHRPSVLLPIYKRISPDDIVCLDPGDELMVVIPPIGKNTMDLGCKVLRMYNKKFQNVIKQTCVNIHPADHPSVCDWLCSHHYLPLNKQMAMEFPVRVRNYAEQHLFVTDHPDRPTIIQYWNQGAGINVSVCGYTTWLPVLLQLKYLAFLEIYRKLHSKCYKNNQIAFNSLSAMDGHDRPLQN